MLKNYNLKFDTNDDAQAEVLEANRLSAEQMTKNAPLNDDDQVMAKSESKSEAKTAPQAKPEMVQTSATDLMDIKMSYDKYNLLKKQEAEIDQQIKKLRELKAKCQEQITNEENSLIKQMDTSHITKLAVANGNIAIHHYKDSVEITDKTLLPAGYMKQRVVTTPDKNKMYSALANHVEIPGAKLVTNRKIKFTKNKD